MREGPDHPFATSTCLDGHLTAQETNELSVFGWMTGRRRGPPERLGQTIGAPAGAEAPMNRLLLET